jgi:hypothetical protein
MQPETARSWAAGDGPPADPAKTTTSTEPSVKKAPVRKAVTKTAPAKTTSVKTAVAKKAPAKKAPATKAAAKQAVARKAPAKKAVAKKAPAVVAAPVAETAPAAAPPAPSAPAPFDLVPGLRPETTVLPSRRGRPGFWRLLVLLSLLLLAAAIAMGVAALVMHGDPTWKSESAVRLVSVNGAAPSVDQLKQLQGRVHLLTAPASQAAAVPEQDVRADLGSQRLGSDQLVLEAQAARKDEAERLAAAAASVVVARSEAAGFHVVASSSALPADRTRPSLVTALVTGSLAGAAFLLLIGSTYLLRRPRNSS